MRNFFFALHLLNKRNFIYIIFCVLFFSKLICSCSTDEEDTSLQTTIFQPQELETCETDQVLSLERGDCNESLPFNPEVSFNLTDTTRIIISNSIPNHKVGLFGRLPESLNPN